MAAVSERTRQVRRGLWLEYFTVGWNVLEGVIALASGLLVGSIALVGFGLDSFIEVAAGSILIWRLWGERHGRPASEDVERRAIRLVGITFFALATYVTFESITTLVSREVPEVSPVGLVLVIVSLIVMPALAWGKRKVARQLNSAALQADSQETLLCVYLSAIVLLGLAANALFGWWWADPVAGFGVAVLAIKEGWEAVTKQDLCCD